MNKISAVIITLNEERSIQRCIESVLPVADEIIVVDSLSSDATQDICSAYPVQFISRKWEGYAATKNYANTLAKNDLILSIDADEALSPALTQSIMALKEKSLVPKEVFAMNRLNNYCGKWIKGCGLYPDTKIRIWQNGFAQWEGLVHEWLNYKEAPKITLLNGDLLHYSWDTPEEFSKQQFHFAELGAQSYFERGKKTGILPWLFSPSINFIRTYFVKGGFLYGKTGLEICKILRKANRHKYDLLRRQKKEERNQKKE